MRWKKKRLPFCLFRSEVNCLVKVHVRSRKHCAGYRSWTFAPIICTPNVLVVMRMSRRKRSLFNDARKAVAMVTEDKQSLELLLAVSVTLKLYLKGVKVKHRRSPTH